MKISRLLASQRRSGEVIFIPKEVSQKMPNIDMSSKPKPFKDIPTPKGWPLLGHIPLLMTNRKKMHELHAKLRKEYGDIYKLNIPGKGKDMVCIVDPKDAATLLRNDGPMPILPNFASVEKIRKQIKKFTTSGLFCQGEEWHKFRQAVQQELMRPKSATFFLPELSLLVEDVVKKMVTQHMDKDGQTTKLHDLMQERRA